MKTAKLTEYALVKTSLATKKAQLKLADSSDPAKHKGLSDEYIINRRLPLREEFRRCALATLAASKAHLSAVQAYHTAASEADNEAKHHLKAREPECTAQKASHAKAIAAAELAATAHAREAAHCEAYAAQSAAQAELHESRAAAAGPKTRSADVKARQEAQALVVTEKRTADDLSAKEGRLLHAAAAAKHREAEELAKLEAARVALSATQRAFALDHHEAAETAKLLAEANIKLQEATVWKHSADLEIGQVCARGVTSISSAAKQAAFCVCFHRAHLAHLVRICMSLTFLLRTRHD